MALATFPALGAGMAQWQEGGKLLITSGDYRLLFRGDAGRMIETLHYRDVEVLGGQAANQALLNIAGDGEKEGRWLGGSYGGEEIESFELFVDGQPVSEAPARQEVAGQEFKVVKRSRMGPVNYEVEIEASDAGIVERAMFRASGDSLEKANFLYAFSHSWSPEFKSWYAAAVDGPQQGDFSGGRASLLDRDATGLAFWNPKAGLVALFSYPEAYTSKRKFKGKANRLWDQPTHRRLFLRMDAPASQGEERRFEARLVVFEASGENWQEQVRVKLGAVDR